MGGQARKEAGSRDFPRVSSEHSIDFFPHLKLSGGEADGDKSSAEIRVAASEAIDKTAGDAAEETGNDRDSVDVGGEDATEGGGEVAIEGLGKVVWNGEIDGVGKVDVTRRNSTI